MVTNYKNRKITITRTRRDGFRAWRVRIENQDHWVYMQYAYPTEAEVLDRICKALDFVDDKKDIAFDWYMYAKTDPRRQKVLDHQSGKHLMTDEERGITVVNRSENN